MVAVEKFPSASAFPRSMKPRRLLQILHDLTADGDGHAAEMDTNFQQIPRPDVMVLREVSARLLGRSDEYRRRAVVVLSSSPFARRNVGDLIPPESPTTEAAGDRYELMCGQPTVDDYVRHLADEEGEHNPDDELWYDTAPQHVIRAAWEKLGRNPDLWISLR